jgi:hypothetical protein
LSNAQPISGNEQVVRLESKKYSFLVEDTMPILNFELKSNTTREDSDQIAKQNLTIELHSPLSGEVFEARTPKGRIEVDNDGTITCFSIGETFGVSLFLGRNISITMNKKTGVVLLKTPSRIKSIEDQRVSSEASSMEPFTDSVKLVLE